MVDAQHVEQLFDLAGRERRHGGAFRFVHGTVDGLVARRAMMQLENVLAHRCSRLPGLLYGANLTAKLNLR